MAPLVRRWNVPWGLGVRMRLVPVAVLVLRVASCAWAPVQWNDFKCLDDAWVASLPADIQDEFYAIPARFDDRLGEPPRYQVDDARLTAAWQEYLTNATVSSYDFFGYGVNISTPGRAVAGDSSNRGWVHQGELDRAIVVELNGWDSHYIISWIATILLKEQIGYNVVHFSTGSIDYSSLDSQDTTTPPSHVNIEKWDLFHKMHTDERADGILDLGATGFTGIEGIYTSEAFVANGYASNPPFFALWWEAYLDNDDALGALNYTLDAAEASVSYAACLEEAADDANWVHWNASDCDMNGGFFVTEACAERQAVGRPCGTLILMDAKWANEMLVIIIGLRLPMRLAFLGFSGAIAHIEARLAADAPVFFPTSPTCGSLTIRRSTASRSPLPITSCSKGFSRALSTCGRPTRTASTATRRSFT